MPDSLTELVDRVGRFFCNVLDWHKPGTPLSFNGPNLIGHCQRCSRRLCQDSQGNWFALKARGGE